MKLEDIPQSYRDMWKGRSSERTVEYAWVWQQLKKPPKKVLDIGCVESQFSIELSKLGYYVEGIDFRQYGVHHQNFLFRKMDFFDLGTKNQYDYTIAVSTLEHFGSDHYGKSKYRYGWFDGLNTCMR